MFSLNHLTDGLSNTIKFAEDAVSGAIKNGFDLFAQATPVRPVIDRFPGLLDLVQVTKPIAAKPEFESSYKGLIDGINDLSKQIDAKKAELEKPDLDPSARMQLSIEMQELMQMRLQMITITTNLLKTDHDSAQAVNNNLRA